MSQMPAQRRPHLLLGDTTETFTNRQPTEQKRKNMTPQNVDKYNQVHFSSIKTNSHISKNRDRNMCAGIIMCLPGAPCQAPVSQDLMHWHPAPCAVQAVAAQAIVGPGAPFTLLDMFELTRGELLGTACTWALFLLAPAFCTYACWWAP